jgi:hypothetical protein
MNSERLPFLVSSNIFFLMFIVKTSVSDPAF